MRFRCRQCLFYAAIGTLANHPTSFHPALPWPEQLVQSLAAIRLTARVDLVGREDGDARRDRLQEGSWRERHDAGGSGGSVDSRRDPVAGCTKSSQAVIGSLDGEQDTFTHVPVESFASFQRSSFASSRKSVSGKTLLQATTPNLRTITCVDDR
jgi:hypothetical protein